jgi:hypothetical protein
MSKSLQEILLQQQAREDMLSKYVGNSSITDTIAKLKQSSLSVILEQQHKNLESLTGIGLKLEKERIASFELEKYKIRALPSYMDDAIKLSKKLSESTALGHIKSIIDSSSLHHLRIGETIKNFELGSAFNTMAIENAIGRLVPKIPALFASEALALQQFKSLGSVINSANVFSEVHTKALRASLGDWRGSLVVPTLAQNLYVTQGFDRGLTELPDEEFYDVVSEAGLTHPSSDIKLFGPVVVDVGDENLSQEERNAKCYARIYRLENRLRTFIDEAMTARYGKTWFKQLPNNVKENLIELQEKKKKSGEDRTLIECTDFSHYIKILLKGDLWRDVFSPLFGTRRKEDVQESLNRLKPIRDTAMHSNPVSHEDWVMLYFETGRLLQVISKLH